jgi:hypothetical protein
VRKRRLRFRFSKKDVRLHPNNSTGDWSFRPVKGVFDVEICKEYMMKYTQALLVLALLLGGAAAAQAQNSTLNYKDLVYKPDPQTQKQELSKLPPPPPTTYPNVQDGKLYVNPTTSFDGKVQNGKASGNINIPNPMGSSIPK